MGWGIWAVFIPLPLIFPLAILIQKHVNRKNGVRREDSAVFTSFIVGVFLSIVLLCASFHFNGATFHGRVVDVSEVILVAVFETLCAFTMNLSYDFVTQSTASIEGWLQSAYIIYAALMFVLSPLLTFSVVLSFFKNISASLKFMLHYNWDVYVFSELNDKALSIAKSVKHKKIVFIFADVYNDDDEQTSELIQRAKALNGICFKKDVLDINLNFHNKDKNITFFLIGENESENVEQTLILSSQYENRPNTKVYTFSVDIESELLLSTMGNRNLRTYRINEIRSRLNRMLYTDGKKLFDNAKEMENGKKLISAVIVGMGGFGTEMTKTLAWFCQMEGYEIEITCIDSNKEVEAIFSAKYPELVDKKFSGDNVPFGESKYKIDFVNCNVEGADFVSIIKKLKNTTYVMVSLGSDRDNINTAVYLRQLTQQMGISPQIQAIVYDTKKKNALKDIKNYSGMAYDIEFIGDIESTYSEDVIINSELEQVALGRHIKWGDEADFWKYEYNYRSSIASALHKKLKSDLGIPGTDKPPAERTEEELMLIRVLEHKRWNAYMRSEGYCYGETRNNLAKLHPCLVPFNDLSLKEQLKDDD